MRSIRGLIMAILSSATFGLIPLFSIPLMENGNAELQLNLDNVCFYRFLFSAMLMGVIVNNGIVLVEYINQLRQEGGGVMESIATMQLELRAFRVGDVGFTTGNHLQAEFDILGIEPKHRFSEHYVEPSEATADLRDKKRESQFCSPQYFQMFMDRTPFVENASMLDLLMCEGREAIQLLDSCRL